MNDARNDAGQNLEEFLADYQPGHYERPSVTVDIAILTQEREVLMIRRKNHPNIGAWALPGGFIEMNETLYESALRELQEETSVENVPLSSVGIFAAQDRDPRTRIITAAFSACVPRNQLKIQAGDDAADAKLFSWEIKNKGRIVLPSPSKQEKYELSLPATATGELLTAEGTAYDLMLTSDVETLGARLAIDDDGTFCLLGDRAEEGLGKIASDHALILFAALQRQ